MRLIRPVTVTTGNLVSDVPQPEALWNVGTTYGAAAAVYEIVDGVPMSFTSKAGGNVGHQPSADTTGTYWNAHGPTNRWAMFDGTIQTQTVQADEISVQIQLGTDERIDSVRVGNISAATLQVTIEDATDGVVYDETFDLTSASGITDWYAYFAEAIVRLRGKTVSGLPSLYSGALVTITLAAPGEDVACGLCLIGLARDLGGTQWGPELSFRDLSVKDEDAFGGTFVVERGFKRQGSFSLVVQNGFVDELQRLLEDFRAQPVLFVGNDDYDTMAIYGFVKSFKTVVTTPDVSFCSLDLESLA